MSERQLDLFALPSEAEESLIFASSWKQDDRTAEILFHEFDVKKQTELEMQNEHLQRANVDLDESCDRYMDLFNFSPVGYFTATQAGVITEINYTAAVLFGVNRHNLMRRHFSVFITPEDCDRWHLFFVALMEGSQQQSIELTLKHNDGTTFPVQLNCLLVTLKNKNSEVRITITGLAESKRATAHLSEVELNAALSLINAEMGAWEWNIETGRVIFNEHWAKIRGYQLKERDIYFNALENGIHPDDLPVYHAALMAHLEGRTPFFQAEYRVCTESGSWLWLLDRGAVIKRDTQGVPLRMAGIEMNITERQSNENELRIASTVFESQEEMMVTDSNAVVPPVNHAFTRSTGCIAAEAINQEPCERCPTKHDEAFYQTMFTRTTKQNMGCAELRVLYDKFEKRREEERKHISHELHDELGQLLSVIRLSATTLDFRFGDANTDLRNMALKIILVVDYAIKAVRTIATRLRPVVLRGEIVATLKWFVKEYVEITGIACEFHGYSDEIPLEEYQAMTVFRIIQESLTNVLRHSGADHVDITVRYEADVCELEVRDNGVGFDLAQVAESDSIGIIGMQERALGINGTLDIVTMKDSGTQLTLRIPIEVQSITDIGIKGERRKGERRKGERRKGLKQSIDKQVMSA